MASDSLIRPRIEYVIFDMDGTRITLPFSTRRLTTKVLQTGLLIDTESVYTQVTSTHHQTTIHSHPRTIHRADR